MKDLIERWQSGDEEAFDELFHQFKWLVFKNALIITGNKADAEDVLQEVFIRVWKSRHAFDIERGRFINWLYRITINQSISRCRKKKNAPFFLDESSLYYLVNNNKDSLGDVPRDKLEYERLNELVNNLSDKYRVVLVLRYFNDLKNDAIADILNIPLGTVKSRIHNALMMLRKQLESAGTDINNQDRVNQ
jgi:RNA polymerase sigma-70 factor (ECF subfamily)